MHQKCDFGRANGHSVHLIGLEGEALGVQGSAARRHGLRIPRQQSQQHALGQWPLAAPRGEKLDSNSSCTGGEAAVPIERGAAPVEEDMHSACCAGRAVGRHFLRATVNTEKMLLPAPQLEAAPSASLNAFPSSGLFTSMP